MGWLIQRETSLQVFIEGVRWVDAIKHHQADAEAFANWAVESIERIEAFSQAWRIWHEVSALSAEQREYIERMAGILERTRREPQ